MARIAIFIDAGYFWVQVSTLIIGEKGKRSDIAIDYANLRLAVLKEKMTQFPTVDLLRVYWYDGPGGNGKTEEHLEIEKLDDFKLRLGTRNREGAQKAVDGLVLADMISLAQSKAITGAILVSGDADMVPGVVASQAMGLRVHLLSIGSHTATSPYLAAEADLKVTWTAKDISEFANAKGSIPSNSPGLVSAGGLSVDSRESPGLDGAQSIGNVTVNFTSIAELVYRRVRNGPNSHLLSGNSAKGVQLPREIDGQLLYLGKKEKRSSLAESEKRCLREEFKKLLVIE